MEKFIGFRALLNLLPSGFKPTVPNNGRQKSWSLYILGRWKSLYQKITIQLRNLPHILCHVLLPKLQSALSVVRILSYNFFLHGVSFATLSKPSSFMRECHALHFVKVSVHMQCFVPIKTNFVKNIKPHYSYLGKFCRDRCNYVNLSIDVFSVTCVTEWINK